MCIKSQFKADTKIKNNRLPELGTEEVVFSLVVTRVLHGLHKRDLVHITQPSQRSTMHTHKTSVAGVLLFKYIVCLVWWCGSGFIGISVRSPSTLMWIGLYWHYCQFAVYVELACSPPTIVCLYVLDDRHAIDRHVFGFVCGAEVVQSRLIRSNLTTVVIRRMVCVLCTGSSWLFMWFEQSRKLSKQCQVCYGEQLVNAVGIYWAVVSEACRPSVSTCGRK